jgi:hypothetical protein
VGCVVYLPGFGTIGVMSYVSRISPTFVVVVGTGVIRFLVLLQKTHVVYLELHSQVMRDRSRS